MSLGRSGHAVNVTAFSVAFFKHEDGNVFFSNGDIYVGNSISKLQIQVATYVFELSPGKCHR
jgi:hypothetical protein